MSQEGALAKTDERSGSTYYGIEVDEQCPSRRFARFWASNCDLTSFTQKIHPRYPGSLPRKTIFLLFADKTTSILLGVNCPVNVRALPKALGGRTFMTQVPQVHGDFDDDGDDDGWEKEQALVLPLTV